MTTFRADITLPDILAVADMVALGWSVEVGRPPTANPDRPILVTLLPNDGREGGFGGEGTTVAGALAEAVDNVMSHRAWDQAAEKMRMGGSLVALANDLDQRASQAPRMGVPEYGAGLAAAANELRRLVHEFTRDETGHVLLSPAQAAGLIRLYIAAADATDDDRALYSTLARAGEHPPDALARHTRMLMSAASLVVAVLDSHGMRPVSCDRDGRDYCDCLDRPLDRLRAVAGATLWKGAQS